jgi:hypothetical protein
MSTPDSTTQTPAVRAQKVVVAILLVAYTIGVGVNSSISMTAKAPMLIVGVIVMAVIISALAERRGWLAVAAVAVALAALLALGAGMYRGDA